MAGIKQKSGFTLIEVMIALAILLVGLVGIIGVQIAGIHQLGQAKQRTTATQLGAEILEHLKNVPVNPSDPAQKFSDVFGNELVDADGNALLYDEAVGDGYLTWHRLRPMRADGTQVSDINNWTADYFYLVIYGVEWGGPTGSTKILAGGETDPLSLAQYPDTVPGPNQIYIEIWVGWVDSGQKPQVYSGTRLNQVKDYYDVIIEPGSAQAPKVNFKRKVVMKTVRRVF